MMKQLTIQDLSRSLTYNLHNMQCHLDGNNKYTHILLELNSIPSTTYENERDFFITAINTENNSIKPVPIFELYLIDCKYKKEDKFYSENLFNTLTKDLTIEFIFARLDEKIDKTLELATFSKANSFSDILSNQNKFYIIKDNKYIEKEATIFYFKDDKDDIVSTHDNDFKLEECYIKK